MWVTEVPGEYSLRPHHDDRTGQWLRALAEDADLNTVLAPPLAPGEPHLLDTDSNST